MSSRGKAIVLTCVAPGCGQFALRRYVRGVLMLGGAIVAFVWGAWFIISPVISNFLQLLAGHTGAEFSITVMLKNFLIAIAWLFGFWGWSFIDIVVFKSDNNSESNNDETVKTEDKDDE